MQEQKKVPQPEKGSLKWVILDWMVRNPQEASAAEVTKGLSGLNANIPGYYHEDQVYSALYDLVNTDNTLYWRSRTFVENGCVLRVYIFGMDSDMREIIQKQWGIGV